MNKSRRSAFGILRLVHYSQIRLRLILRRRLIECNTRLQYTPLFLKVNAFKSTFYIFYNEYSPIHYTFYNENHLKPNTFCNESCVLCKPLQPFILPCKGSRSYSAIFFEYSGKVIHITISYSFGSIGD